MFKLKQALSLLCYVLLILQCYSPYLCIYCIFNKCILGEFVCQGCCHKNIKDTWPKPEFVFLHFWRLKIQESGVLRLNSLDAFNFLSFSFHVSVPLLVRVQAVVLADQSPPFYGFKKQNKIIVTFLNALSLILISFVM